MTLTATKSASAADSYISVSGADAYFDDHFGYEAWTAIKVVEKKEQLLRLATKQIDQLPNKYHKLVSTQSLRFPVTYGNSDESINDYWNDGFEIAQEACCIQAFYIYQIHETLEQAKFNRALGTTSESMAGASNSFSGFNSMAKYDPETLRLLRVFRNTVVKIKRA